MNKIKLKFKILFTIIILLVIAFFVRIKDIDVVGAKYHDEAMIKNLVFPDSISRISLICLIKDKILPKKYNVPNIERIDVKFKNFVQVELIVLEKPIIGYIRYLNEYYYFDEDLYILDERGDKNKNYIEITGIRINKNKVGDYLKIDNKNASFVIKKLAQYSDIINMPIENVDFINPSEIQIVGDGLYVNVGNGNNIEEKISLLIDIYPKLEGMHGILDLSKVKTRDDKGEYIFKKVS